MWLLFTLLPVPRSLDIRGWTEMHPLNGPAWSLFFEYIANILYALWVRKFSTRALAILVGIAGVALAHLAITSPHGDVIGGYQASLEAGNVAPAAALVFFGSIALAYACLRLYDVPVRRWLTKRYL